VSRIVRTSDGRRVEVSVRVAAERDRVWALFRDTEAWPEWGPSVRAVESPRRYVEAGTEGRVRTVGGVWLPFRVRTCAEYRWTWDVAWLPATGHRVDSASRGCLAVIEVPLAAAPYAVVCKRGLRRLRELAESG
jgi:hypothetical protein